MCVLPAFLPGGFCAAFPANHHQFSVRKQQRLSILQLCGSKLFSFLRKFFFFALKFCHPGTCYGSQTGFELVALLLPHTPQMTGVGHRPSYRIIRGCQGGCLPPGSQEKKPVVLSSAFKDCELIFLQNQQHSPSPSLFLTPRKKDSLVLSIHLVRLFWPSSSKMMSLVSSVMYCRILTGSGGSSVDF